jgi:hypothetical protein
VDESPTFELGMKPKADDRTETHTFDLSPNQEEKDPRDRTDFCVSVFYDVFWIHRLG